MTNKKVYGLLGLARRAGKIVFGTESVMQAIEKRKVKAIVIAQDAAERTKRHFIEQAQEKNIPIREVDNMENLSKSIGQENKAIVGIMDGNFSKQIIKWIDGGDMIG